MDASLLEILRRKFGTVSSRTESSGVVAVRNKTALKDLQQIVEGRATVTRITADRFPALCRITELAHSDETISCDWCGNPVRSVDIQVYNDNTICKACKEKEGVK